MASEEETWSKLSDLIFYNNWKGIYSQLLPFAQQSKNATLVASLIPTFDAAYKCLSGTVKTQDTWSKASCCLPAALSHVWHPMHVQQHCSLAVIIA